MMTQLQRYGDRIRSSLWFLPSLLIGGGLLSAFGMLALDDLVSDEWLEHRGWAYSGSAEGASTILGTIAGSMITIAGVIFSLTLVALTLASNQFGPRLLRNFMRDTMNQAVIGAFVATFLYCLLVLRSIRREGVGAFVPHISVTVGVLFALASVGLLIYYIHHVAVSIQADELVARVYAELVQGIDRMFPEQIGRGGSRSAQASIAPLLPEGFDQEADVVRATTDGYLQLIDPDTLLQLAMKRDLLIYVERQPGDYVGAGSPLVRAWPRERVDERLHAQIQAAFILGSHRTPVQDLAFSVGQLVEIAVRALSPSLNDWFTPITCVDRLGSALSRLAQREAPRVDRRDKQEQLRVIAIPQAFPDFVEAAFGPIQRAGRDNTGVCVRLLETIERVGEHVCRPVDRAALRRQADRIVRGAREHIADPEDVRLIEDIYGRASQALSDVNTEGT